MKVLIVDDEENQCLLYKLELEEEGYEVITATTSTEGLMLFEQESPDIVTLDICLSKTPQNDEGLLLLRQMKKIKPKVPVIMLTAYDMRDDFSTWCADAYIVKSHDLSELKRAIRNCFEVSEQVKKLKKR